MKKGVINMSIYHPKETISTAIADIVSEFIYKHKYVHNVLRHLHSLTHSHAKQSQRR